MVNTICHLCFNKKYDSNDSEFQQILKFWKQIDEGQRPGQALSIFPWLRFFPDTELFKNFKEGVQQRHRYTHSMFEEHIKTFDPDNIRDMTDNLLYFSQNKQLWKDAGFQVISQDELECNVM